MIDALVRHKQHFPDFPYASKTPPLSFLDMHVPYSRNKLRLMRFHCKYAKFMQQRPVLRRDVATADGNKVKPIKAIHEMVNKTVATEGKYIEKWESVYEVRQFVSVRLLAMRWKIVK